MPIVLLVTSACVLAVLLFNGRLYVARWRRQRCTPACDRGQPLGLLDAAWAFTKECAACVAVVAAFPLGWLMPRCRSGPGTRGPVVLIAGRGLNTGSLWLLRRRLLRDGWSPVCCVNRHACAATHGLHLPGPVDLPGGTGRPLTLVGHGEAGVALWSAIQAAGPGECKRIVTLGTCYDGTAEPGLRSAALDAIAIHSTFDATLVPASALDPGALNIQLNDVGHHTLLFSTKVYQLLAENLAAPLHQGGGTDAS